jgi:hypothetical protein
MKAYVGTVFGRQDSLTPNDTQWKHSNRGGLTWTTVEEMPHLPGRGRTREDYCGVAGGAQRHGFESSCTFRTNHLNLFLPSGIHATRNRHATECLW